MTTLVVPAAGKGSRLDAATPKALIDLGGRPLIDWVLSAARGRVDHVVVVIQPDEQRAFDEWAGATALPAPLDWGFQHVPEGSLAAVRIGVQRASEVDEGLGSGVVIVWADQVGAEAGTIRAVADAVATDDKVLVVPLAETPSPYVWVELDDGPRIARVLRSRDGDASPAVGLADLGVFGLSGSLARAFLEMDDGAPDAGSRERDFTYALPALSLLADRTVLPLSAADTQLIAVNTPEDLARAHDLLRDAQ